VREHSERPVAAAAHLGFHHYRRRFRFPFATTFGHLVAAAGAEGSAFGLHTIKGVQCVS
jgi:hypothetical protein